MSLSEFHPELRSKTRVIPKAPIRPLTLPIFRVLSHRRTDLAGLPPAWIGVGSLDLFHDEDLAYAERLRAAGVPCETLMVPGAFHGFDSLAPHTRVAADFFDSQCEMLRKNLADHR